MLNIKKRDGINQKKLILPKVVAFGRKYYECSSLDGIYLENSGGSASAGSHWESTFSRQDVNFCFIRIFIFLKTMTFFNKLALGKSYLKKKKLNLISLILFFSSYLFIFNLFSINLYKIMSPQKGMYKVLSGFTLNFFDSTGWYITNHDMTQHMAWGRHKGCKFIDNSCKGATKYREFCSKTSEKRCSYDYTSPGVCKQGEFENKCIATFPFTRNYKILECTNKFHNFDDPITYQYYGPGSSCLMSSVQNKDSTNYPNYYPKLFISFFFF